MRKLRQNRMKLPHKAGFVSIVGKPNVGKSTLMNKLVGENLSIITPKAQTTRHRIMGIINSEDFQIVYSDTPGILRLEYAGCIRIHDLKIFAVNNAHDPVTRGLRLGRDDGKILAYELVHQRRLSNVGLPTMLTKPALWGNFIRF